jgi:hypothetical protein
MANTFLVLLEIADVSRGDSKQVNKKPMEKVEPEKSKAPKEDTKAAAQPVVPHQAIPNLRYNIEIHLPATNEIEVYNSIFKSLKEHLLDD